MSVPDLWDEMVVPPILVSKANVMIGYNPIYEYAALPDVERIVSAIQRSVQTRQERAVIAAGADRGRFVPSLEHVPPVSAPPATAETRAKRMQNITVPAIGDA